jgi:predicted DNA-binding transcriptional regulator AlpA
MSKENQKPKEPIQQRRLIPDARVRERYSISAMTLYRWDADPSLGFPRPIYIKSRKYRSEAELDAFDAAAALRFDAPRRASPRTTPLRGATLRNTSQHNDLPTDAEGSE